MLGTFLSDGEICRKYCYDSRCCAVGVAATLKIQNDMFCCGSIAFILRRETELRRRGSLLELRCSSYLLASQNQAFRKISTLLVDFFFSFSFSLL